MDLEEILFEFTMGFQKFQSQFSDPNKTTLELYKYIRDFAKKHKQKPDLITQFKEAVQNEQYEIAHILKKQITEILENNGLRKGNEN